jgi:hypothetical protein
VICRRNVGFASSTLGKNALLPDFLPNSSTRLWEVV